MAFGIKPILDESAIMRAKQDFGKLMNELRKQAENGVAINTKVNNADLGNINNQVKNLNNNVNTVNNSFKTMGSNVLDIGKFFIKWNLAMTTVTGTVGLLKQGLQEIVDINKMNANVAMITNQSIADVEKLNSGYLEMADNLKVLNKEVMAGSEAWLRSGVNMEEANKNLETTTKLSKIASVSNKEMADSLIVIKNSYGLNSEALQGYASKVALLDNQSATSSEKINAAMQYSAETFKSMGIDMDTALSYITNFSEKSAMSGEAIGRGFRSMLTNFHKLQAGFKTGSEEEVFSVNKIESILNKKNLSLRKNKDEWLDLGTVIKNIQQNIGKFNDIEKSELAFRIGNKEQAEMTLSTLNNMKRIDELNVKLKGDSGAVALNNSYSKYMDSIEAKQAELRNSATKFWMDFTNSKAVGSAISGFTEIIKAADRVVAGLGGVNTAILGITATFLALKSNAITGVVTEFMRTSQAIGFMTTVTWTLQESLVALKGTMLALAVNPITWIATAVAGIVGTINNIQKEREEIQKLTAEYKNLKQAIVESNIEGQKQAVEKNNKDYDQLTKLIAKRNELKGQLDNGEINQMNFISKSDELNQMNKKIEEFSNKFKEAGYSVNSFTGSIEELDVAQKNIDIDNKVKSIENAKNATINHSNAVLNLIDTYKQLSSKQNRTKEEQELLNSTIADLKGNINELTVVVDENGNMTIQNAGILGQQATALENVKTTAENSANAQINKERELTEVIVNGTTLTIQSLRERVNAYKEILRIYKKDLETSMATSGYASNYLTTQQQQAFNNIAEYEKALNSFDAKNTVTPKSLGSDSDTNYMAEDKGKKSGSKSEQTAYESKSEMQNKYLSQLSEQDDLLKVQDNLISNITDSLKYQQSLGDRTEQLKLENQLYDQQNAKLKQLNANKEIYQKTETQAADELATKYGINAYHNITETDIQKQLDSKYGGTHSFGTGKAAEQAKDQFEQSKKEVESLFEVIKKSRDGVVNLYKNINQTKVDLLETANNVQKIKLDTITKDSTDSMKPLEEQFKSLSNAEKLLSDNDIFAKAKNKVDIVDNLDKQLALLVSTYSKLNLQVKEDGKVTDDEQKVLDEYNDKITSVTQSLQEYLGTLETLKVDTLLKPFESTFATINNNIERYNFLIKASESTSYENRISLANDQLTKQSDAMQTLLDEYEKLNSMAIPKSKEGLEKYKSTLESLKSRIQSASEAQDQLRKSMQEMSLNQTLENISIPQEKIQKVVTEIDTKISMGEENLGNMITASYTDSTKTLEDTISDNAEQALEATESIDNKLADLQNLPSDVDTSIENNTDSMITSIENATTSISSILSNISSGINAIGSTLSDKKDGDSDSSKSSQQRFADTIKPTDDFIYSWYDSDGNRHTSGQRQQSVAKTSSTKEAYTPTYQSSSSNSNSWKSGLVDKRSVSTDVESIDDLQKQAESAKSINELLSIKEQLVERDILASKHNIEK